MSSLFDRSDDSTSCSENSTNNNDDIGSPNYDDGDDDDDATSFTISNVLQKRDSSRRDTITRTMPTISIHDDDNSTDNITTDKYAIPNTVQKKQIDRYQQEERLQLRVTESLIDDDSDSDDNDEKISHDALVGCDNDQATLSQHNSAHCSNITSKSVADSISCDMDDDISSKSKPTTDASKQTNLLDEEELDDVDNVVLLDSNPVKCTQTKTNETYEDNDIGTDDSPKITKAKETNRRHSSDTFMSVYQDLASKSRDQQQQPTQPKSTQEEHNYNNTAATVRGIQVKTLVTTALKTVAEGLASHVTSTSCDDSSWDVEKIQHISGNKRSIENDGSNGQHQQRFRRKSFNIRAELTLLQDMLHEKTEECASLKQQLEESHSQIESLHKDTSIIIQSKANLESKLGISRDVASAANARVELLSSELKESQSEVEKLAEKLQNEQQLKDESARVVERLQVELNHSKVERETVEKARESMESRAAMQQEIQSMRNALKEIKQIENDRVQNTQRLEAELLEAREALSRAYSAVADSEAAGKSLRESMETVKRENHSLRSMMDEMTETKKTPQQFKMKWNECHEEGTEGIEIQMNGVTPKVANLDNINSLGAEDASGSDLPDHVTKIPLKAVLKRTPDSSSKQLSFASSKSLPYTPPRATITEKENNQQTTTHQPECSLCFHPPRPNGAIKSCQCGKATCQKWAHAYCLLNRKSVSSCVSHPGTPAPPLPTILCDGIWCKEI